MTIDIQEASRIYQTGIEVGRAMAKREADEFSKLITAFQQHAGFVELTAAIEQPATPPSKHAVRGAKSAPSSSGTKKAPVARTKGVKEAILALITADPMSPAAIIGATGFKSTSVRATLMSLKIAGLATNDDGRWIATNPVGSGNSEAVKKIHDRFPETLS